MTAEQLEAAARRALARGPGEVEQLEPCPVQFFRGFTWQLYAHLSETEAGLSFGVFLQVQDDKLFARGQWQWIRCKATVRACQEAPVEGERPQHAKIRGFAASLWSIGGGMGKPDFWGLGPQVGWAAATWAAKGLLLEGGRVVRVVATLQAP